MVKKKGWKRCWLGHPPDVATSFRTTPTQPPLDASVGSDLPFGVHAFALMDKAVILKLEQKSYQMTA